MTPVFTSRSHLRPAAAHFCWRYNLDAHLLPTGVAKKPIHRRFDISLKNLLNNVANVNDNNYR